MLLFLTLFAFAPREQALRSGPPTIHLARTPAEQWRLSSQPRWIDFQSAWGGEWYARWDERNGTPRFLGAPGVDEALAWALVDDVARLSGVDPDELTLTGVVDRDEQSVLRWTREWRGAEVVGDEIALVITRGRVGAIWVRLTPIGFLDDPRPGESVLSVGGKAVLARGRSSDTEVRWTDRGGSTVLAWDPRRYATVSVACEERTVGDDLITNPAKQVSVTDAGGTSELTDADGVCSLSGELEATLEGPHLRVTDASAAVTVSGTDDFTITGGEDVSEPAASVQHHTHVVRDWLEARWPEHAWLPEQVLADVNQAWGTCNAYYTSGTINFLLPGSCNNLGRIADVIYHEYGHGVHDYILAAGTFASDVSEGSADYVSATITDDPAVAPEFVSGWSYLRELDTDKVYPDDAIGESHNDGLIWGSFLWNLREQWVEDYGEDEGVALTDLILLGALEQGPEMTDLYEAVLVADDDDGDWSNGTPHDCELIELLDHHGLGPGALGIYQLEWAPIEHQGSADEGYPLAFSLYTLSSDCGIDGEPLPTAWYTTDEDAKPPLSGAAYDGWTELALTEEGSTWSAELPRVPANSRIRWFIELTSADDSESETIYGDIPDNLPGFWVGDRAEVWCDDLEGDTSVWTASAGSPWVTASSSSWTSTWVFDTPTGATWKPDAAYSGGVAALTGLEDEYPASNLQTLLSPSVVVPEGLMPQLAYRRWLTVEDGYYDQAMLHVLDAAGAATPLWTNPRTSAGTTAFLDTGWVEHEISLQERVSGETTLSFAWSIQSDAGLEFGGWAIDDICVYNLDDVPGHYRVDDLRARRVGLDELELSWSVPWITPLAAAVLVRSETGWPTGPSDGELLATVDAPVWGEVHTLTVEAPARGTAAYYAVFTAGESAEDWYTEVVAGENGLMLGGEGPDAVAMPEEEEPAETGDSGDTGETGETGDSGGPGPDSGEGEGETETAEDPEEPEQEKGSGCAGCSSAPAGGAGGLAALAGLGLLVGIRRSRRP